MIFKRGDDIFHIGGTGQFDRRLFQLQAFGADTHLINRFLSRNIVAFGMGRQIGNAGTGLKQQSRFADAGVAADQNGRTGNQPAAANTV